MDDEELQRLAQEELLQEAKRAQKRAEEMGPIGWQRCPLPATNKRFLHNMLISTLEPREKKSRCEDMEDPNHDRKHKTKKKTLPRERDRKRTYRHKEENHGNKPQNSKPKSKNKWRTDESPYMQHCVALKLKHK
ncbi:protein POLR1D-like [Acropora millepora]|uniref:protein POLR1D-like n=1 Tax=Acropora millepora TaxID=45264 RepID=UPI001CF14ADA|nr:protein POLR1D-like [Acropora millepora]